jgi:hypothetical protein
MSSQISHPIWHSPGGPIYSTVKNTTEVQIERGALITLENHLHIPMGHHLHIPIGNTACTHNAESPHLRCAVNPCGPCEGCPEFEAKP